GLGGRARLGAVRRSRPAGRADGEGRGHPPVRRSAALGPPEAKRGFVLLPRRWVAIARTMLPRAGMVDRAWLAGVAAAGWRGDAEDDLDPAAVDLDPPDQGPDDVPPTVPVEIIEPVADRRREVLALADDQGQLPFGFGSLGRRPPPLLEAGDAGLEARDTRLELGSVEHALGVAVDQP